MCNPTCSPVCGDGILKGEEECEDENDESGDGCDNCIIEEGWTCDPEC